MYLVDCACSCTNFCLLPSIRGWRIDFKISELVVGELTHMREVPAKTTKSRQIRIVAGRRFWRFLLVNQLPLSIMAVYAQYRAIPLTEVTWGDKELGRHNLHLLCRSLERRGRLDLMFPNRLVVNEATLAKSATSLLLC